jgi:hypothetical protein
LLIGSRDSIIATDNTYKNMILLRQKTITALVIPLVLLCLGLALVPGIAAANPATKSHPANSKAGADCGSGQHPKQIDSGSNQGKWYCVADNQAGLGGGHGFVAYGSDKCGGGPQVVLSINIGCWGRGNPIADAAFAIIRVLSAGVGLVVVASIVIGGIQYSASRGDPQATALAIGRIRSSLIALLIFIFAYAILNFVIPAGFLHP